MHVIHKKNVKFLTICATRYKTSTIPDHRNKMSAFFRLRRCFLLILVCNVSAVKRRSLPPR